MKILHVLPSYKPAYIYAGVIESASRLCEGLAEAGHIVHVFTTTANGQVELDVVPGKEHDVEGVKVIYFKRITKDPTHVSPGLWRHLFRHCREYDAVHLHTWWNVLVVISAWICILKRVRMIITPEGMLCNYIFTATHAQTKKWIHHLVGRRALSKTIFHATAQSEYNECKELIRGWKGFLLPNILLLPEVQAIERNNTVFTLIFLSRVHPKKGLELLLDAMVDLPFEVRLNIAGTGDEVYVRSLRDRIVALGLDRQVTWLGWMNREEKYIELMRSDCFVLTSHNENFANVVIESLHVGTPVLVSEQVGLAPFVQEKDLGWVTALDVDSIRRTIIAAYNDKSKRDFVNECGRRIVDDSFGQLVLIDQYVQNYLRLKLNKVPEGVQAYL